MEEGQKLQCTQGRRELGMGTFQVEYEIFFFLFYLTFILGKNVPNLVQGQLAPSNSSPMLCSKYMFARVFQLTFYRT